MVQSQHTCATMDLLFPRASDGVPENVGLSGSCARFT
jgi:hypothetical protein